MFPTLPADASLQILLNQDWRSSVLDTLLPLFSRRTLLFVLLSGLLVWRSALRGKGQAIYFIMLVLAMGASDLTCNAVKHAVPRLRPMHSVAGTYYEESGQWLRLPSDYTTDREKDTSFPSAHAANSASLVILAMLFWPRLRRGRVGAASRCGRGRGSTWASTTPRMCWRGGVIGALIGWGVWMLWKRAAPVLKLAVHPDDLYRPFLLPPPGCK